MLNRRSLFTLTLLLAPFLSEAQCLTSVNFNTWTRAGDPSNGNWAVQSGGTQVFQSTNGNPTFYISPYDLINVEVTGEFRTTDGDDDFMGFVFGFNNPLGTNYTTYDMLLFDWKRGAQASGGFSAPRGMCLSQVVGTVPNSQIDATFWGHVNSPQLTVLANDFGGPGWVQGQWHQFRLIYTFSRIIIYVDNVLKFDVAGCFKPGRFGFYNYSQPDCTYRNFNYSLNIDFSIGSTVFCPNVPVDFIFMNSCVTNFSFSTIQSMTWDFGDGNQFVNTSPDLTNINPSHAYTNPGTYQVTLTLVDVQGCSDSYSRTVTINPSPALTYTIPNGCVDIPIQITNSSTGGNGSAITAALWNMGDGNTLNGINPGAHTYSATGNYMATLQVTDANSCTASASSNIIVSGNITAAISATDANCPSVNDGTATLANITNGIPPHTFNWNNAQQTQSIQGLIPNTYSVTITDSIGCSVSYSTQVGVNNTTPLSSLSFSTSDYNGYKVSCNGFSDGSATIQVNDGNAPYGYTWNDNQNTATAQNLPAGNYTVSVSDANTCTATATVMLNEPPPLNYNSSTVNIDCNGNSTGSINLTVSGGVAPYLYSWNPSSASGTNLSGLSAGTYNFTVTDENNCILNNSVTLTEPAVLSANSSFTPLTCYESADGAARLFASGGTPVYLYELDINGTYTPNGIGRFNDLSAGTYNARITDNHGCQTTTSVTVTQPDEIQLIHENEPVKCYGENNGTIRVQAAGGTAPFVYEFEGHYNSTGIFEKLSTGVYEISITDANGCPSILPTTITQPDSIIISVNPLDSISLSLGESRLITLISNFNDVTYNWEPSIGIICAACGQTEISPTQSTTYLITAVINPNGKECSTTTTFPVTVIPDYRLYIPNAFSPNGDGSNDVFEIFGNKKAIKFMEFKLFNRWGEKLFESNDIDFQWDGHFNSSLVNPGIYPYQLKIVFIDSHPETEQKGTITVLR